MSIREDCRHYVMQSVGRGERLERCRVGAADALPFSCPDGCVFYEARSTSRAGWRGVPPPRPEGGSTR